MNKSLKTSRDSQSRTLKKDFQDQNRKCDPSLGGLLLRALTNALSTHKESWLLSSHSFPTNTFCSRARTSPDALKPAVSALKKFPPVKARSRKEDPEERRQQTTQQQPKVLAHEVEGKAETHNSHTAESSEQGRAGRGAHLHGRGLAQGGTCRDRTPAAETPRRNSGGRKKRRGLRARPSAIRGRDSASAAGPNAAELPSHGGGAAARPAAHLRSRGVSCSSASLYWTPRSLKCSTVQVCVHK
ncbi:uncharacterized protein LOC118256772 [Cygnus atratus]|uniref:uncharacterized protein LOC118256772 n=1 Tax=Cygnus atratus TaxID=8868 RepID=UPI0021B7C6E3|nr:uncharacterized protein LOC118256772 [Cygnus atratus]